MGLASKMVLAYGVSQAAPVIAQLSKPSPYPAAPQGQQGYGQPQGHAQSYYNQGQPQQQQQHNGYAPQQAGGYNPGYAAAGAAVGAAMYHSAGQPQQQQQRPPAGGPDANYILRLLQQCVQDQNLHAFYPPGSLEPLAQRIVQSGALTRIASQWQLPMEFATDLAKLALFDVVLYIDDSGSMLFEENGSRVDDAKMIVGRAATAASLFDQDGLTVRFMNSPIQGNNIVNEQQASHLLSTVQFSGLTPLGTALNQRVIEPLILGPARANALRKPVLVIAVSDGEPAGEPREQFANVIRNAKNVLQQTRYGPDSISIELCQVGNDRKAKAYMDELDNDPHVGNLIDVTGTYENEQEQMMRITGLSLQPNDYLCKILLGGIDSSYDRKDERTY